MIARIANQNSSPTQMVGVTEKMMFPHTVVGMQPAYPGRAADALGNDPLEPAATSGAP